MNTIRQELLSILSALPCTVTLDGALTENALPVAVLLPGTESVTEQCDTADYALEVRFSVAVYADTRTQAAALLASADTLLSAKGFRLSARASRLTPDPAFCEEAVYRGIVIGNTVYQ